MPNLFDLNRIAGKLAAARGHKVKWFAPWHGEIRSLQRGECRRCGDMVYLNNTPERGGVAMHGEALSRGCSSTVE